MRGGKKTYPRVTSPFLPCRSSLVFSFTAKKKKFIYNFNPQKALARLLQSSASGCFRGVSGLSSCTPWGSGPRRDFLRAGGGAGAEDAAATAAPGGADSAGEGGAAAAAGPWRVARSRPPGRKLLASAGAAGAPSPGGRGSPYGLLAPTSLRRQEAPVSSRRRLLRDSPRRAREPPCPPSALSWRSGPSAAAEGLPRRTQGLRGRALSSSAPAGWLCLRRLSPARRADRARRPAGSAGAARGQDPPCAERTS